MGGVVILIYSLAQRSQEMRGTFGAVRFSFLSLLLLFLQTARWVCVCMCGQMSVQVAMWCGLENRKYVMWGLRGRGRIGQSMQCYRRFPSFSALSVCD